MNLPVNLCKILRLPSGITNTQSHAYVLWTPTGIIAPNPLHLIQHSNSNSNNLFYICTKNDKELTFSKDSFAFEKYFRILDFAAFLMASSLVLKD